MKTRSKMLPTALAWGVMILMLGFLSNTLYDGWQRVRFKPEAREEMRNLWDRVQLGDSQTQFGQKFAAGNYQLLELRRVQTQKWLVTAPIEWGAGNWHLHIEWDANGRIGALRIRTNDSIHQRPRPRENAPADRISPGFHSAFPKAW